MISSTINGTPSSQPRKYLPIIVLLGRHLKLSLWGKAPAWSVRSRTVCNRHRLQAVDHCHRVHLTGTTGEHGPPLLDPGQCAQCVRGDEPRTQADRLACCGLLLQSSHVEDVTRQVDGPALAESVTDSEVGDAASQEVHSRRGAAYIQSGEPIESAQHEVDDQQHHDRNAHCPSEEVLDHEVPPD